MANPGRARWLRSPDLLLRHETQRRRVPAVALARGTRPVVEDVAEMRAAAGAHHLDPFHHQGPVGVRLDVLGGNGGEEAGPARARVELRVRAEEVGATGHALVETVAVLVPGLSREGPLRALLPGDLELSGGEGCAPLFLGLDDPGQHDVSLRLLGPQPEAVSLFLAHRTSFGSRGR